MIAVILFIVGILIGGTGVYVYSKYLSESVLKEADQKAKKVLSEAALMAENTLKSAEIKAKDEMLKLRKEFEEEAKSRRAELNQLEQRLTQREIVWRSRKCSR
jgi:ribonuclease Y